MAWSLPEGFEVLSAPGTPGVTLIVSRDAREALLLLGIESPESAASGPLVAGWVAGGRVRHPVIQAGQERWLLKAYRRGGFLARWNPDRYWRIGRFLRELRTARDAASAGVPAPEPIALILKRGLWWRGYRAWQVVRYVSGVSSLSEILEERALAGRNGSGGGGSATSGPAPGGELGAMFRAAGRAVRKMHEAEIDHPDLNVGNILARPLAGGRAGRPDPAGAEAFIVDWDRARRRRRGSWNPHRNLFRLWRSAVKMARRRRPRGSPDPAALRSFLRGYFGQNRAGLKALRGYLRPRRALLALHVALWEITRLGKTA